MVRRQFFITEEQDRKLNELAEKTGESRAEIVRGAIEDCHFMFLNQNIKQITNVRILKVEEEK